MPHQWIIKGIYLNYKYTNYKETGKTCTMPQATALFIAYNFHVVSLCFLLSLLSPPLCLPPLLPSPSPLHTPSHHPGQPMWSEWSLIQGVRPCLKCNKLPLGQGTVHPSRHITRDGACAPPSLTSSSTPHPSYALYLTQTHTQFPVYTPFPSIISQSWSGWLCHPSSCAPLRIISVVRTGSERKPAETWVEVRVCVFVWCIKQ